jgi:hypothetical protein
MDGVIYLFVCLMVGIGLMILFRKACHDRDCIRFLGPVPEQKMIRYDDGKSTSAESQVKGFSGWNRHSGGGRFV